MSSFKKREFCVKHIKDLYIPTTTHTSVFNRMHSDENSMRLVTQTPCIDGFVNTSNRLEEHRETEKKMKRNDFSFLYTSKQREDSKEEVE